MFDPWQINALFITIVWAGLFTTIAKAFIGLKAPSHKQFVVCMTILIVGIVIVHILSFIFWGK